MKCEYFDEETNQWIEIPKEPMDPDKVWEYFFLGSAILIGFFSVLGFIIPGALSMGIGAGLGTLVFLGIYFSVKNINQIGK